LAILRNHKFLIGLVSLVALGLIVFWPGSQTPNGPKEAHGPSQKAISNKKKHTRNERPSAPGLREGTSREHARRQDRQDPLETQPHIRGQVTDPAFHGIAKATIQILSSSQTNPSSSFQADTDGFFEWQSSSEDPSFILVSAPGFFSRHMQFPTGQENEVIVLEPGGQFEVRAIDEEGLPVADALVQSLGAKTHTDDNGQALLNGVSLPIQIHVTATGYNEVVFQAPQDVSYREIILLRDGALIGRVIDDATNQPVSQFRIKTHSIPSEALSYTFSDPEGQFQVEGLSRQQKEFIVFAEGYMAKAITLTECLPLAKTEPIEVSLSDEGFFFAGKVIESGGQPIPHATVTAMIGFEGDTGTRNYSFPTRENGRWLLEHPWIDALETQTNADGQFKIGPFPEGAPLGLLTTAQGFAPTWTKHPESLVDKARLDLTIVVKPYSILEGEAGQADAPYPRGITLTNAFQPAQTIELEQGQSTFRIENLIPGRYSVHFKVGPSFQSEGRDFSPIVPDKKEVLLQPGATESIQIGFSDQFRMAGRIHFNGQPMANTRFVVQKKGPSPRHFQAQTDANGEFDLHPLASGTYEIMANGRNEGFVFGIRNRELIELETDRTELSLNFYSMGSVYGRVVTEPIGATILMEISYQTGAKEFATNLKRATVQAGGHFEFNNVPGGDFILTLMEIGKPNALLLPSHPMPDDGTDLDLGDIGGEAGNLLITLTGYGDALHQTFSFYYRPHDATNTIGRFLVQMSAQESPKQLHGLQSGQFIIQPQQNFGFQITPSQKAVVIQKHAEATVHFSVKAETFLRIGTTPGDNRLEFSSVRLVEKATGKTWPIPFRVPSNTSQEAPPPIELYYQNHEVLVRGIPAGIWQLTLQDQYGRIAMRQFRLVPGKPILQNLGLDAFATPRKTR